LLGLDSRDRLLLKAVFLDEAIATKYAGVWRGPRLSAVLLHRAKHEFKAEYVKRAGNQMFWASALRSTKV